MQRVTMSYLLDHIKNGFVTIQPYVVVRDSHLLEGDSFGVLEEGIWSPHPLEPADRKQSVLHGHVLWKAQAVIFPALRHEDVCYVRLQDIKDACD
ncbi:uncharacterized protein TNCT_305841 [Trichonephila clavata]|uniref:Uncharacterized protein n=1 Tax=Trichonephila clavata TaxID=2740835 RepID=A0A8X6J7U8_TRICU|nr:uncharacterized protein TNCT_305841 [Trichonephila clavata]